MLVDKGTVQSQKKQMVPDLRFSGFEGEWSISTLESITKKKISYGIVQAGPNVIGGMPYIKSKDLNSRLNLNELERTSEEIAKKYKRSEVTPGDLVFSLRGNIGVSQVLPDEIEVANLTQGTARISTNDVNDVKYVKYLLETRNILKKILAVSKGSTFQEISLADLRKLKVPAPSLKEQQKIANFLTAIDQRITLLKQKKAALKQYKKGLMQKIFSQEIRFTDDEGNDFPGWEEKRFDELYEFKRTNSLSREKLNYDNGEVFNIHYGDIHTKFKTHFELDNEYVPFVNSGINLSKIKEDEFIQTGDLVIADASEDYEDIGKAIEINHIANSKVIAGLHTFLARRINDLLKVGFGGFIMQSAEVRLQIKKIAQGTKVLGISMGRLGKIKLKVPSKKEQQKIADCLSAIDQSINQLTKQIDQTTQFKKGLLQRMFV